MLVTVDASSMIHAWDNYPIEQFPALWEWLCEEIETGNLSVSKVAYEEIKKHYNECAVWMDDCGIVKYDVTNDILRLSLIIRRELGIVDDAYGGGVGENDILIIATAKSLNTVLMSNEKVQTGLPANKKNYKIPAVCQLDVVSIECIDFLHYFKRSGKTFR